MVSAAAFSAAAAPPPTVHPARAATDPGGMTGAPRPRRRSPSPPLPSTARGPAGRPAPPKSCAAAMASSSPPPRDGKRGVSLNGAGQKIVVASAIGAAAAGAEGAAAAVQAAATAATRPMELSKRGSDGLLSEKTRSRVEKQDFLE